MGRECIRVMNRKKEMSRDEYYLELLELHKKYPLPGHKPALTAYHYRNPERFTVIQEYNGVKYKEKVRPLNFKEAAEFYAQRGLLDPHQTSWIDQSQGQDEQRGEI